MRPIGQGGFGRTFLAIDEDKPSKPFCVIKQFFPQTRQTHNLEKASQMFEREAIRLDDLGLHPQIPDLMAYFCQDNRQYLVQEFIEGHNLAQELLTGGAFSEADIRALLEDILPVLQFVHQNQVIHRDIKPENIILRRSDNRLFLVDFGAAKEVEADGLEQTGTAIGSMGYVAREQAIGRATYASDLYSLGVTCIHLLTGVHPFHLFDPQEGTWVWRDRVETPVSNALCQILDQMLAMALSQRYKSAEAILQDLQIPWSEDEPSSILDLELEQLMTRFTQRNQSKPSQLASPSTVTMPNPIDVELEELRAEFLGSTNQKKPPAS
jgi:serine/threonine protein kinase